MLGEPVPADQGLATTVVAQTTQWPAWFADGVTPLPGPIDVEGSPLDDLLAPLDTLDLTMVRPEAPVSTATAFPCPAVQRPDPPSLPGALADLLASVRNRSTMLTNVVRTLRDHPSLNHPNSPFPFHLDEGMGNVVVIVGENASGKSVLFKTLTQALRPHGITGITISIRERTGGNDGGLRRTMMFGQEAQMSTGHVSVSVIERGFRNARNWAEQGNPNVLMLDEPELGLSDGYAGALGDYLAQEVQTLPEKAHGLVVVTHSRSLVRRLCHALPVRPHLIVMGETPRTLEQWWDDPEHRSVADLFALQERGRDARSRWTSVQNEVERAPVRQGPAPLHRRGPG